MISPKVTRSAMGAGLRFSILDFRFWIGKRFFARRPRRATLPSRSAPRLNAPLNTALAQEGAAHARSARHPSPNPFDAVGIQRNIVADHREIFAQGLRDEHPVEGIAVMTWKTVQLFEMSNGRREDQAGRQTLHVAQHFTPRPTSNQLPERRFDRQLPERGKAYELGVGLVVNCDMR